MNKFDINDSRNHMYFQWHFLENCNLKCIHCYQDEYNVEALTLENIFKIAKNIEMALKKWSKVGRISLTGGEPFLKKDLLLELLNFFNISDSFYWLGILTNGTLIDKDILVSMKKMNKLKEIQVSLDGSNSSIHDKIRGNGTFEKAIHGINLLKSNNFNVSIMFTLQAFNKNDYINIIDLAKELNVEAITIERSVKMGCNKDMEIFNLKAEDLKKIYSEIYIKKKDIEKSKSNLKIRTTRPLWVLIDNKLGGFCPIGFTSMTILHDGTVLPCRRLEIPIGNILKDGLYKIWYTSDVLWKLRNKNLLQGKCNNCNYLAKCGGCRAIAYAVNNDFLSSDPQCWKGL